MRKIKTRALLQVCGNGAVYAAVSIPVAWLRLHNLKPRDRIEVAYDDEKVVIRPLRGNERAEE